MTLDYGTYGMFLIVGNAGFISSTVVNTLVRTMEFLEPIPTTPHTSHKPI